MSHQPALLLGFACGLLIACSHAGADMLTYSLEDVVLQNGQPLTGAFEWTYDAGDFEGGVGEFTSLQIPYTIFSIDDASLIYDIQTNAIEITGDFNLHDQGLDIKMKFLTSFGPTQSAAFDLGESFFECCGNGFKDQPFQSGAVVPLIAATGDYNGDSAVNLADYAVWRESYGETGVFPVGGENPDGNGDGTVDAADYTVWRDNYGAMSATAVALSESAVPEPTGFTLLALAGGVLLARRRGFRDTFSAMEIEPCQKPPLRGCRLVRDNRCDDRQRRR